MASPVESEHEVSDFVLFVLQKNLLSQQPAHELIPTDLRNPQAEG